MPCLSSKRGCACLAGKCALPMQADQQKVGVTWVNAQKMSSSGQEYRAAEKASVRPEHM